MAYRQRAQPWLLGASFRATIVGTKLSDYQTRDPVLTNSQYPFSKEKRDITMSLVFEAIGVVFSFFLLRPATLKLRGPRSVSALWRPPNLFMKRRDGQSSMCLGFFMLESLVMTN